MSLSASLSRRDLLKLGGALIVTFASPARLGADQAPGTGAAAAKSLDPSVVDSFLAIHADGSVTVYTGKVDIGTGLRVAVAQMAGEELGVSPARITVIDGDTGLCPDQGGTGGSTGLTRGGTEIRRAAATARHALLGLAATRLNRPVGDLTLVAGEVRPVTGGSGIGLGELVGGRSLELKVDPNAPLVPPARYTVVGQPLPRPDVPDKCTGRHVYVHDFRLPGMLHARVIRPPAIGATLVGVDESSIAGLPDVRIVRLESFLAVVAPDEWAAIRAATMLRATWTDWQGLPDHNRLDAYLRDGVVERDQAIVSRGDFPGVFAASARRLAATYSWPCQSHASLGPSCAVADVRGDAATIWSASQGVHGLRTNLARTFGLATERVRVVFLEGSGSYGSNGNDYAAADAVLLSKTLQRPVRVQWSRQDELGWDPKGPPQMLDVRAGLDANGRIAAWETETWVPSNRPGGRALLAASAAGLTTGTGRNAANLNLNCEPPYQVPHVSVVAHWVRDTPLVVSNLRAPGKMANLLALEGFMDELATAAAADPVAFRLNQLTDPRAIEALTRAAAGFGWTARPSPNPQARQGSVLVGRGVAYTWYKHAENHVAMAMEVAVEPASGQITVRRVTCAHDCGLIVNPDALRNQIEGCIVQGLSRTLYERVTFDQSRVTSVDWVSYPLLAFPAAPEIDVVLIDRPDQPLLGAGEAAAVPVAAAVANAVFDATGVRLRAAPFTPDRVKAALAATGGRTLSPRQAAPSDSD
jgi:CO/xanthine dehydrogenase Mo-binding subunit